MKKHLNKRIGIEFYNTLIQHPAFRDNYTAISGAEYLLIEVAKYNETDKGASQVSSRKIDELFKNYDKTSNYRKYIDALIDLGLLNKTNPKYCVSTDDRAGWCKRYMVTTKGLVLITNNLKEYLKKLHFDPEIKRLNEKSIYNRGVLKKSYNNFVLDYIWDGLMNMSFDYEVVCYISETIKKESWPQCFSILTSFVEKRFKPLEPNQSDGRIWNEYVALKEDFKIVSYYKDMVRMYTLDIRACHPTFWGLYMKQIYFKDYSNSEGFHMYRGDMTSKDYSSYNNIKYLSKDTTSTKNISPLPIPYCSPKTGQGEYSRLLLEEIDRYNDLFTNQPDPRKSISEATGYEDGMCKTYLNRAINGHRTYKRLYRYLQSDFPLLYDIWIHSDIKATGNNISKLFETKLILNPELFKLADSLNVKLMYEYDGFSLFFDRQDTKSLEKAGIIEQFIKDESKRLWGLDIMLKLDAVGGADGLKRNCPIAPSKCEEMSLAA
jgi:hypothetical protein